MRRIKVSALLVLALSILFFIFFQYCKHAPGLGAANPFAEDPYDAVGSFAVLLAPLAGLLAVVRAFRPYPQGRPDPRQLLLILRSETVALLALAVTLVADGIGLGRTVLTGDLFPAAGPLAALVGTMGLLALLTGWACLRPGHGAKLPPAAPPWRRAAAVSALVFLTLAVYPPGWREAGIPGGIFTALLGMAVLFIEVRALAVAILPGREPSREDIIDDCLAIFQGWKRRPGRFAFLLVWLEKLAASPRMAKVLDLFRPRRHRWHLVIAVAALLGLFLLLPELIVEGVSPNWGKALLVAGAYIGIGASGVLLGYVLLGGYLGIY